MIEDHFTEARREWDGIIAESPDAEGFFLRGICLEKLGEPAEADFVEAAGRSPSNALFSNKLYLVLIRSGQRKSVSEKIRTGLELRNESLQSGWTVANALIALQEDNRLLAEMLLDRAAGELSPAELALLLEDPAFDPDRASPSLLRFFWF